jgi:hypothetical protein
MHPAGLPPPAQLAAPPGGPPHPPGATAAAAPPPADPAAGPPAAAAAAPWRGYETVFTNAKAGMGGVDKERVQRIVYEMSKNSPFFAQEQKKLAQVRGYMQSSFYLLSCFTFTHAA